MRKIKILIMCGLIIGLWAYIQKKPNFETHLVTSKIYSQEEINEAIEVITTELTKDWPGCTLKEIYYGGDDTVKDYQDWALRNSADEVIVLMSTFDVDSSGGDGSLNPNSTYENWSWILVRTDKGKWQHVDHGY